MDDALRQTLFDPEAAHDLVLAHRPPVPGAVHGVVSDVVWGEVVRLLRWATAETGGSPALEAGTWWRLAAECAVFLRRYPGLSAEIAEPWDVVPAPELAGTGAQRVTAAADRLTALLHSAGPLPLHRLAAEVHALGAAAIGALAEHAVTLYGCNCWPRQLPWDARRRGEVAMSATTPDLPDTLRRAQQELDRRFDEIARQYAGHPRAEVLDVLEREVCAAGVMPARPDLSALARQIAQAQPSD